MEVLFLSVFKLFSNICIAFILFLQYTTTYSVASVTYYPPTQPFR